MNAPLVNAVETGKNIKRLREEKGITVKELQKIFGFDTPQAIYRWQRGEILPCLDNLLVLMCFKKYRPAICGAGGMCYQLFVLSSP